jgi:hypothetical protein
MNRHRGPPDPLLLSQHWVAVFRVGYPVVGLAEGSRIDTPKNLAGLGSE